MYKKSVMHVLSCCSKKLLCFRRFRCCCRRSFVRSPFLEKEGVLKSLELKQDDVWCLIGMSREPLGGGGL